MRRLRLLVMVSLLAMVQYTWAQGRTTSATTRLRQIQQQYQKLVQDLYSEEAKIQQRQAEYGQRTIDYIRDAIQDLVGTVKQTPPAEDPGESPLHYVEFLIKARQLADTTLTTIDGIVDSKTSLAEKDLRLQKLNQDLGKANAAMKNLADVLRAARNPDVKLEELPYPEKDWSTLDEAIAQMRKEDMPLESQTTAKGAAKPGDAQKQKMTFEDREKQRQQCSDSANACFRGCRFPVESASQTISESLRSAGAYKRCIDSCSAASEACYTPLLK